MSRFFEINSSDGTLVSYLLIADKCDLKESRDNSIRVICDNFKSIPNHELQELDGNVFCEILSNDALAANEMIIFDHLKNWLSKNRLDRAKFAVKLLNAIRLEHIPLEVNRDLYRIRNLFLFSFELFCRCSTIE